MHNEPHALRLEMVNVTRILVMMLWDCQYHYLPTPSFYHLEMHGIRYSLVPSRQDVDFVLLVHSTRYFGQHVCILFWVYYYANVSLGDGGCIA